MEIWVIKVNTVDRRYHRINILNRLMALTSRHRKPRIRLATFNNRSRSNMMLICSNRDFTESNIHRSLGWWRTISFTEHSRYGEIQTFQISLSLFIHSSTNVCANLFVICISSMKFILDSISRLASDIFIFFYASAFTYYLYTIYEIVFEKILCVSKCFSVYFDKIYSRIFQGQNRSNRIKIVIMLCACEWDSPVSTYDKYMWESAR